MIKAMAKRRYTFIDLVGQIGITWLIATEHNWWYVFMAIPLGLLTAFIDSVERVTNNGFHK